MCMALAAVADHGALAGEQVDVSFAVNGCQRKLPSCQRSTSWRRLMVDLEDARLRPTRPVRTSSLTPWGRRSSSNESISSRAPASSKTMESGPRAATRAWKTSPSAITSVRRAEGAVCRTCGNDGEEVLGRGDGAVGARRATARDRLGGRRLEIFLLVDDEAAAAVRLGERRVVGEVVRELDLREPLLEEHVLPL